MSTNMDSALKTKVDEACRTAGEFTNLYYASVDKRRSQMSRLYLETGLLVWNGNEAIGNEKIQKYFMDLPASEHIVLTLDAQPIVDDSVSGQPTFLIQVSGTVKFQSDTTRPFQQTFMITAVADKWKIASDCFRMQDALVREK